MLLAAWMVLAALPGCTQGATALHWPPEEWLVHEDAGVAVAIPPDWVSTRTATAVIAGGPEGTPDSFVAVTIQALRPAPRARFDQLLASTYARRDVDDALPVITMPCVAGDALGACYSVSFTVLDEPRRRVGMLIDLTPYVVDVSLVGPAGAVSDHFAVFERALATLYIEPAG